MQSERLGFGVGQIGNRWGERMGFQVMIEGLSSVQAHRQRLRRWDDACLVQTTGDVSRCQIETLKDAWCQVQNHLTPTVKLKTDLRST